MPVFTPQTQSNTALQPVLISHPAEGRRLELAWVAGYIRR